MRIRKRISLARSDAPVASGGSGGRGFGAGSGAGAGRSRRVTPSAASRPIAIAPAPSPQRDAADQLEIHWSIASVEEASVMRPSSRARVGPCLPARGRR
jgi:hypothetical protein